MLAVKDVTNMFLKLNVMYTEALFYACMVTYACITIQVGMYTNVVVETLD